MALFRKQPLPGSVPALFLHIQKTAGTSILHLARKYYGDSIVSHGDCWGKSPDPLRQIRFISGHIGYDFAQPLMPGRYTFTFLRDPAERILSMYYFCRTRDPAEFVIYKKARELDLPEFLEAGLHDPWVRKNIWNNQVWQLAHGYAHLDDRAIADFGEDDLLRLAKAHLAEFSHVGFTETFAADAVPILEALGLPRMKNMPQLNDTPGRPGTSAQSPDVRDLLRRLTELDLELYEYARHDLASAKRSRWWRW
jgi:hypothetical protein